MMYNYACIGYVWRYLAVYVNSNGQILAITLNTLNCIYYIKRNTKLVYNIILKSVKNWHSYDLENREGTIICGCNYMNDNEDKM